MHDATRQAVADLHAAIRDAADAPARRKLLDAMRLVHEVRRLEHQRQSVERLAARVADDEAIAAKLPPDTLAAVETLAAARDKQTERAAEIAATRSRLSETDKQPREDQN